MIRVTVVETSDSGFCDQAPYNFNLISRIYEREGEHALIVINYYFLLINAIVARQPRSIVWSTPLKVVWKMKSMIGSQLWIEILGTIVINILKP